MTESKVLERNFGEGACAFSQMLERRRSTLFQVRSLRTSKSYQLVHASAEASEVCDCGFLKMAQPRSCSGLALDSALS